MTARRKLSAQEAAILAGPLSHGAAQRELAALGWAVSRARVAAIRRAAGWTARGGEARPAEIKVYLTAADRERLQELARAAGKSASMWAAEVLRERIAALPELDPPAGICTGWRPVSAAGHL